MKAMFVLVWFLWTIGFIIPAIINNLPMPYALGPFLFVGLIWLKFLEKPAIKLFKWMDDRHNK